MSKALPKAALIAIGSCCAAPSMSTGLSLEAEESCSAARQASRFLEGSESLFGSKAELLSLLRELEVECSEHGWNGYDAKPLSPVAAAMAERLILALPDSIPPPELSCHPDGQVALDWTPTRYRQFSLSTGPTSRIAYAWLNGSDSGHAVARFDGQRIPDPVLQGLLAITRNDPPTFRS